MLAAFIAALSLRCRLSRRKIQEFLRAWLALELAAATIERCVHEFGLAHLIRKALALAEGYYGAGSNFGRDLAGEIPNDWGAVIAFVSDPNLPPTNNDAEARAPRRLPPQHPHRNIIAPPCRISEGH